MSAAAKSTAPHKPHAPHVPQTAQPKHAEQFALTTSATKYLGSSIADLLSRDEL